MRRPDTPRPARSTRRAGLRTLAALAASVALLTGCGGGNPPVQDAPELGVTLEQIDAAVVDGDLAGARDRIDELVTTTEEAHDEKRITDAEAARILGAAARLLDALTDQRSEDASSS